MKWNSGEIDHFQLSNSSVCLHGLNLARMTTQLRKWNWIRYDYETDRCQVYLIIYRSSETDC